MRNTYSKDNKLVFSFINSKECFSYDNLRDFLIKNDLPLLERWAFYFFGKKGYFDKDKIDIIGENIFTVFEGNTKGEIYFWKKYLLDSENNMRLIQISLHVKKGEIDENLLSKEFIKRGWEYVKSEIEFAELCESERSAEEFYSSREVDDSHFNDYEPDKWDPFEGQGNWGYGDGQ